MIKVSICCITYNHAEFIRQCLDGFLMQQTNFDYEILINDDCSGDGTQEIIKEYVMKYPQKIRAVLQDENQYSKGVRGMIAKFLLPLAKGKFIAICEGDDYWTDPRKLQQQFDFLERHSDCVLCATNFDRLHNGAITPVVLTAGDVLTINKKDLLLANPIGTLTAFFRAPLPSLPYRGQFRFGDLGMWFSLLLGGGKAAVLPISTAVYRIHGNGVYNKQSKAENEKKAFEDRFLLIAEEKWQEGRDLLIKKYRSDLFLHIKRALAGRKAAFKNIAVCWSRLRQLRGMKLE